MIGFKSKRWSMFDYGPYAESGLLPEDDFIFDPSPFERVSGLAEAEAFQCQRWMHLVARPTAYKEAQAYRLRNQKEDAWYYDGGELDFYRIGITGCEFRHRRPPTRRGRRGGDKGALILVDGIDGHVWGWAEHSLYNDELSLRYDTVLPDWKRDQLLGQFPNVVRTRVLALGEPARSAWLRDEALDGFELNPDFGKRLASKRLYEPDSAIRTGTMPGSERLFGVFRRERWFGPEPFFVDLPVLRKNGFGLFDSVFGGLDKEEFVATFRESFVGAPTVKFRGPLFCGVSEHGLVCVVDDEKNVVVNVFWDHKIGDRYALFELPDWLNELDL
jgi:hypothetical protein